MTAQEKVKQLYPNAKAQLFTEIVQPGGPPATPPRWHIYKEICGDPKPIGNGGATENDAWENFLAWIS